MEYTVTVIDDQQEIAPARQAINEMVDAGLLDHLMSRVDDGGLALTGEGGLLPELVKAVYERGLAAELTDHLGYEKGDPAGRGSSNSRNGSTPKTLGTEGGDVAIRTPRERCGPERASGGSGGGLGAAAGPQGRPPRRRPRRDDHLVVCGWDDRPRH